MFVPPTASPLPPRFTSFLPTAPHPPVRLSTCVHTLLCRDELYIFSCFLALLIGDGRSELMSSWNTRLLTCEHAAGLVLYSLHVLMSMCHFFAPLLVTHGPPAPDDQSGVQCCTIPHVHRSPSFLYHLVSFPFVILDRYNAPGFVMAHIWLRSCLKSICS